MEQRARLVEEQEQRAGAPVYPLDERFLEALGRMPPSGGIAPGFGHFLMLYFPMLHLGSKADRRRAPPPAPARESLGSP